ncbi:MAG: hypothetical protein LBD99_00670 [Candidatus Margulisbacteria bacterium]|jgi:hypothetical protein|nr:hypothetical protein [Candidatus Margulisiibacteriota bacterium]
MPALIYLSLCFVWNFWPLESYLYKLLNGGAPKKKPLEQGVTLIWKPWLGLAVGLVFFAKGLLLGLSGGFFLTAEPLSVFGGFTLALLSEACSPLKKTRHLLALGLGFLAVYQLWGWVIYTMLFLILLGALRCRAPALIASAGLYALTFIFFGNSYQLAAALAFFILLCVSYLGQLRAYFDGTAPHIFAELKGQ